MDGLLVLCLVGHLLGGNTGSGAEGKGGGKLAAHFFCVLQGNSITRSIGPDAGWQHAGNEA